MKLPETEYILRGEYGGLGPGYIFGSFSDECRVMTAGDAALDVYEFLRRHPGAAWRAERVDRDYQTGEPESIRDATAEVAAIVQRMMDVSEGALAPKYANREERERIEWEYSAEDWLDDCAEFAGIDVKGEDK